MTVTSVDHNPAELEDQVPFSLTLLRSLPGPDRNYWLGALDRPLRWLDEGAEREVHHLIVGERWEGTQFQPGVQSIPVNLAYVVDPSQVDDDAVSFGKCRYVAIGAADIF
jgi:hypothetical protein